MGNFSIFTRRSSPMFWLQIRLAVVLDLSPELTAAALGCSSATVKRRQDDLHRAIRKANLASCDEEERLAFALLRAFYEADGGAGAGSEEDWRQVLEEAREDLLARVRRRCEKALAWLDQIEIRSKTRSKILASLMRPSRSAYRPGGR